MSEEWRPIPNFGNYEASSMGRIRRATDGLNGRGVVVHPKGRLLKPKIERNGYRRVQLCQNGPAKTVMIARLICAAFHGPQPSAKHHAAHFNGDRSDNRASNLRWATATENAADKIRHETNSHGERHHSARLKEADVRRIRKLLAIGITQPTIAKYYEISQAAVSLIKLGRNWGWLA